MSGGRRAYVALLRVTDVRGQGGTRVFWGVAPALGRLVSEQQIPILTHKCAMIKGHSFRSSSSVPQLRQRTTWKDGLTSKNGTHTLR